jgi:alkanesulfonate monooxygenase SsuD/methylene tetrahydromethanopterin reductase-like flavin-dependent oxidoreductase (luciferase family)
MLELTGQLADGWLQSLFLLEPEAAYRALDQVRAAAERAERDPDSLTHAYNVGGLVDDHASARAGQVAGSAESVVETLLEFANHGFSAFLFWPGHEAPHQLERLAHEVIPALRDRTTSASLADCPLYEP